MMGEKQARRKLANGITDNLLEYEGDVSGLIREAHIDVMGAANADSFGYDRPFNIKINITLRKQVRSNDNQ